MIRTQIYLTQEEQRALGAMAQESGKTKSELIRLAVDRFIQGRAEVDRLTRLRRGRGIWAARTDLPDLCDLRREWDRVDDAPQE